MTKPETGSIFTYERKDHIPEDPKDPDHFQHVIENIQKALIAGAVCSIVSDVLNPIDVTKIRLQNQHGTTLKYKGFIPGVRLILKEEGVYGLCKGVEASMMREISYSSVRIGAYEPFRGSIAMSCGHNPKDTTVVVKYLSALMSGAIGSALANPLDLVKTRYQANLPGEPLPYPNTIRGLITIYKTQGGFGGLYKGWQVTTIRAAVLTSAQIGSYDSIKNNLLVKTLGFEESFGLHLLASMMAGVITTTATNPADVIKTRYMSDNAGRYSSVLNCIASTFKEDGFRGFFKGWLPAYWRLGPHTVMSLLLIEKTRAFFGLNPL